MCFCGLCLCGMCFCEMFFYVVCDVLVAMFPLVVESRSECGAVFGRECGGDAGLRLRGSGLNLFRKVCEGLPHCKMRNLGSWRAETV